MKGNFHVRFGEGSGETRRLQSRKVRSTPTLRSANFLYVSLRLLLDLQKEVITFAAANGLDFIPLTVTPAQLYGIEINPYAHELAQITVWIGYLQWRKENGFSDFIEPILRPLHNIEHKDAILAYDEQGSPVEPTWPEVDVIVGNPPFLGGSKMIGELGEKYTGDVRRLYEGRIPGAADLVCFWFEKARAMLEAQRLERAGLIATQAIRGGANRVVLERIKRTGDIFMAWSDRDWVLNGATVHVSMIGFDRGLELTRTLNGKTISNINPDLTSSIDITQAKRLRENLNISFRGTQKGGAFDISERLAMDFFNKKTPLENLSNKDVIKPWLNGSEILGRPQRKWIVDFGVGMSEAEASQYVAPFTYIKEHVYPTKSKNRREARARNWWLHSETAPNMREALSGLRRFIVTPRVSKFRIFIWVKSETIADDGVYVFASDADYFFGIVQSSIHELWSRRAGTQLRDAESGFRYTSTTTFETFPFPWPPGQEPTEATDPNVFAIAAAARQLDQFRTAWLNPPAEDIGTIIPSHVVNNLTLTNLYNALSLYRSAFKGKLQDRVRWVKETKGIISLAQIDELDHIHTTLDRAVLDAYGWPHTLTDEQILERILALNLERAAAQGANA